VSLDPAMARHGGPPPSVPGLDAPPAGSSGLPEVTRVQVLPLRDGDRVIVHVDGAAGLSGGGGQAIGEYIRATLKLGELPFDVPVLVVSPGIRVEVARPS